MENKKIRGTTPLEYKNIQFKSKLEVLMYKALEDNQITPLYEPYRFVIWEGHKPTVPFYITDKKVRGIKKDEKKLLSITYTPDIVFTYKEYIVFLEVKGMENDVFPYKRKLFRHFLEGKTFDGKKPIYCQISTKRDLLSFLEILKKEYN